MDILHLMFRSPYDQLALAAMVIGLAVHAAIDFSRRGKGDRDV